MVIDKVVFWRYFMEFLIVIPAAGIAFTPFMRNYRGRRFFDIIILYLLLGVAVFAGAFGWTRYEGLPVEYFFCGFAVIFLILFFIIIKRSFFKKLFFAVNALFLASFCCLYARFFADSLSRIKWLPALLQQQSSVILCLELILMLFFLMLTRNGFSHMISNPRLNYIWKWLALLPLFFTLMITWAYPQDLESMFQGRSLPLALVSLGLIPAGVIGIYRIIITLMNRLNENAKLQKEIEMLRLENKRYEQLRVLMDRSRTVRHDMRQHLLAIDRLAKEGRSEQIAEYVQPLIQVATESNKIFCANTIVDAVAAHYDTLAEQQKTKIDWTLELPRELKFHESDVCSVLGNLLENSLKAVKPLPEPQRSVTVSVTMLSDEILGIVVKNPYEGKVVFKKSGLPRSSKPGHGIGLASVAMVAHKYGGSLNLSAAGGVFSAGVLLYASQVREEEDFDD